jgi:hypothetical protein
MVRLCLRFADSESSLDFWAWSPACSHVFLSCKTFQFILHQVMHLAEMKPSPALIGTIQLCDPTCPISTPQHSVFTFLPSSHNSFTTTPAFAAAGVVVANVRFSISSFLTSCSEGRFLFRK